MLIRGGDVIDGTGSARHKADVAIKGDRIVRYRRDPGKRPCRPRDRRQRQGGQPRLHRPAFAFRALADGKRARAGAADALPGHHHIDGQSRRRGTGRPDRGGRGDPAQRAGRQRHPADRPQCRARGGDGARRPQGDTGRDREDAGAGPQGHAGRRLRAFERTFLHSRQIFGHGGDRRPGPHRGPSFRARSTPAISATNRITTSAS